MSSHLSKLARGACVCAVGAASVAAFVVPGAAVAKTKAVSATQPVSFSGSCTFTNAGVVFSPGLKLAEVNQTDTISGTGSCGSAGIAKLTGTTMGIANCTGGKEIANGTGTLTVGSTSIPVKLAFKIALPTGQLTVQGMTSGQATGSAAFANGNNLMGMPGCVGQGLTHATFNTKLTTSSPITSSVAAAAKPKPKKKPTKKTKK